MEISGDINSKQMCLGISLLFFHIAPKPVQALVKTYDDIFQALATEGDVPLLTSFADLGLDRVVR
jgi:hypothetical protein